MFSSMVDLSQDFYLFFCFVVGFAFFRLIPRHSQSSKLAGSTTPGLDDGSNCSSCTIERLREDFLAKRYEQILEGWACLDAYSIEALNIVVSAFLALRRADDVGLFIAKAVASLPDLRLSLSSTIAAICEPSPEIKRRDSAIALADVFDRASDVLDVAALESLLVAFARDNDETRVTRILDQLKSQGKSATYAKRIEIIQGFIGCKNHRAALLHLELLESSGCGHAPTDATLDVLAMAAKVLPVDATVPCRVEKLVRAGGPLSFTTCCSLIAAHVANQNKAAGLFNELTEIVAADGEGSAFSESSLLSMMLACSQNVLLMEQILAWLHRERHVTVPIFMCAVQAFCAANMPERVRALHQAASANGLELDDGTKGKLAHIAMQARQPDIAELFRKASSPDSLNFMNLVRACGQERDVTQALDILRDFQGKRGSLDTASYNCVLDVCVSCGDQAATQALLDEMKSMNRLDVISYNTLMKQYVGAKGDSSKAEALVEEMRMIGIKPNLATYNSLLNGSVTSGDFRKAWRCIDFMERSNLGVDTYTISIILKGFKQDGCSMDASFIDRALALIKKYKVKLDEVLVNAALEACTRLRDARRLANALDTFQRCGWAMKECNMQTCGMLIKAYGQNRQLPLAWKLWGEMKSKGTPSEQLFGQMIDALVTNGRHDDALLMLEEMKHSHGKNIGSQGFAVAYAVVIRGHAQRKESMKALALYNEMIANGTKVGLVVFNTLVDACSRVGDLQAAARVFQDMIDAQCSPDLITYSTLIKGYCACGDMDQAMELFVVMRQKQIQPDSIVYNSLLDGCAKRQMVGLCEKVLNDMQETGVRLSNHSVSILVKLYGRARDLTKAFQTVDEIPKKYGFVPNVAVFTCLMQACIWNGSLDKALGLRSRMIEVGQYPDEKTYSTLLRGALRGGKPEACATLIHAALDQGGPSLLNEELVQSVLALIRQRRLWDEHGLHLLAALRSKGVYMSGFPDASVNAAATNHSAGQRVEKQSRSRQTSTVKWSDMSI